MCVGAGDESANTSCESKHMYVCLTDELELKLYIHTHETNIIMFTFVKEMNVYSIGFIFSMQLMDGRKATGGRLEVKVRLREPLGGQDLQTVTERWVVLEEPQVSATAVESRDEQSAQ